MRYPLYRWHQEYHFDGLNNSPAYSTNWSGYAVTASTSAVTKVQGSWTVPTVTGTSTAYSSFWVGIDGFNSRHCGTNRHRLRHLKRQIGLLRLVRVLPKPNVPNHLANNASRRLMSSKRNILRHKQRLFRQNKQRIHSYYYRQNNRQDPTRPQEPFQTQQVLSRMDCRGTIIQPRSTATVKLWHSKLWQRLHERCRNMLRHSKRNQWTNQFFRHSCSADNNGHQQRRNQSFSISALKGRNKLLSYMGKRWSISELQRTNNPFFFF